MDNEIDKIKLMNSLLLSMPGSPIIYYGDEIGMGDNFFLGDRNGVRTPMQWSPDRNAGFSRADPQRLYLPPIMDPVYGYGAVNVETQLRERASLLNWMQRVLAVRKSHPSFGRGKLVFLHPGNRKILAYFRILEDDIILCVSNLSRAAQAVELDLSDYKGCVPVEMMGRSAFPPIGELPYLLTLPGHSYYWFRLAGSEEVPAWHEEHLQHEDLPTLVLFDGWRSLFPDRVVLWRIAMAEKLRTLLQKDALPRFVINQRWYGNKGQAVKQVVISDYVEWEDQDNSWLLSLIRIEAATGEPISCFLPLALAWEMGDSERLHAISATTVAQARRQSQLGILGDAFADEVFCRALVQAIGTGLTLRSEHGVMRFSPTSAYPAFVETQCVASLPVRPTAQQGRNTAVVLGEQLYLKGYRHLHIGLRPELEIGRFLSEVAKHSNTAPVLGVVDYQGNDGNNMTLALLQGYVENQGDCWCYTLDYLDRFLEESRASAAPPEAAAQAHGAYLVLMRTLGQRTGDLHNALATATGNADFDPEPVTDADLEDWVLQVQVEATATLEQLDRRQEGLADSARTLAQTLLAQRNTLVDRLQACTFGHLDAVKTRYHGDYHLGKVLLSKNDFVITDFEGEPKCPLAERRRKHSPLRDVAAMLRSFNTVAYTAVALDSEERPEDSAKFEHFVRDWEEEVGRVFLAAYDETVHGADLLATSASLRGLLDLFLLEMALYEVRYELDNRPNWVVIPLRSILMLLNLNCSNIQTLPLKDQP